jgi:hypothetical protein
VLLFEPREIVEIVFERLKCSGDKRSRIGPAGLKFQDLAEWPGLTAIWSL